MSVPAYTDVIASEWTKVRTLRSTYYLLGAAVLALPVGIALCFALVSSWDSASAVDRAASVSADSGVVVQPFLLFLLATFGALVITAEYGTRAIQSSLTAVPDRRRLYLGKAVVVAGTALLVGSVVSGALTAVVRAVVGGRPAPINPWTSTSQAVLAALGAGLLAAVVALVGFGLGAVIRSSAGTLVALGALLFVLPVVVGFLPSGWADRIGPLCLTALPGVIAGTAPHPWLSAPGALAVMGGYVVVALGAGALTMGRRDV